MSTISGGNDGPNVRGSFESKETKVHGHRKTAHQRTRAKLPRHKGQKEALPADATSQKVEIHTRSIETRVAAPGVSSPAASAESQLPRATPHPRLPERLQSGIKELAGLFRSSKELSETTANASIAPSREAADSANEVYMTEDRRTGDVQAVVFKPGVAAANRAMECAGLSRLVGLGSAVPVAKIGTATVSSNILYKRLTVEGQNREILIENPEKRIGEENPERIDDVRIHANGEVTCRMGNMKVKLTPDPSSGSLRAELQGSQTPAKEPKSSFENAVIDKTTFLALEGDNENSFLAPETEVFEIEKMQGINCVTIEGFIYSFKQMEDGSIKLSIPNPKKIMQDEDVKPNKDILAKKFFKLKDPVEDSDVLVDSSAVVSLDLESDEETLRFDHQGTEYEATKSEDGTYVVESPGEGDEGNRGDEFPFEDDDRLLLCRDQRGDYSLVLQDDSHAIRTDPNNNEFVMLNGIPYSLSPETTPSGPVRVVGKAVKGMVQAKVGDLFKRPQNSSSDLDITRSSPERTAFFNRIDMPSFIDSFILTILIRPQDGKIVNLGQSNVLFQAIPDDNGNKNPQDPNVKLKPILIDLDETLPPNNRYSVDPEFTKGGLKKVHCVRCGLMGFPMAHQKLEGNNKERAIGHLEEIVKNKEQILTYLRGSSTDAHANPKVQATEEIIDKIESFLETHRESEWGLDELFFYVFPEYQQQWNMLGHDDNALKAMRIGLESEETLTPQGGSQSRPEPFRVHLTESDK